MINKSLKGKYKPKKPNKYEGDISKITYRSMWERRFMVYCDKSENIIRWNSEEHYIYYISPKDGKWHAYYPDFWIRYLDKFGKIRETIIEIKPAYQKGYDVNKAKWKYAKEYCEKNNYEFKVLTEHELFKS